MPHARKIRILLVDDHIVMRMGLMTATDGEPDMQVVADVENGQDAIKAYRQHLPDVVVLDLRMPGLNGLETIRRLRHEFPAARVLVFSNYAGGDDVFQSLQAGACGFVVKDMALDRLLEAIRKVHEGEQYIPPEVATRMSGRVLSQLSPRELEVLRLLAKGHSNKEMGSGLGIAEGTIKIHVRNILTKLGVSDRTQAIVAAVKRSLIQIE